MEKNDTYFLLVYLNRVDIGNHQKDKKVAEKQLTPENLC